MAKREVDIDALLPFCSTERQREILTAYRDSTAAEAARRLGITERRVFETVTRVKAIAAKRGHAPEHDLTHIAAPGFEVKGTSTLYGDDGKPKLQWVKTRQESESLNRLLEEFTDGLTDKVRGIAKPVPAPKLAQDASLLSAYVIGDAHLGMYAWADETGAEDFDTGIGCDDLRGAFRHLSAAAPQSRVGMLVNVGDALHANDTTSQTPASKHALDTDGRFAQVVDRAVAVFRDAVNLLLKKHAEVWIVNARGNHDPDAAIWLNKVIEAYYHNEPRVKVIPNVGKFIYVEWGKTLIGVHHGDRVKRQQLYEAMTRDKREQWGSAKHVYFWTGHIHHKSAEEIGGCLFESFNTLAPPDAWHAAQGYGANREMQQITLHREFGIVGRNVCGLEMARLAA